MLTSTICIGLLFLLGVCCIVNSRVLVVGSAGFIGYHLTYTLKARGIDVDGVDYLDEKKYPVLIKQKRVWDLLLSHHINVKHVDICEHTEALHQGVLYSHIIYLGASDEFRTHDKPSNSGCFVNLLDKLRKLNGSSRPILLTTGVSIQDCVDSIRCSPHNFNSKLIQLAESYRSLHKVGVSVLLQESDTIVIGGWPRPDQNNQFSRYIASIGIEETTEKISHEEHKFNATSIEQVVDYIIRVVQSPHNEIMRSHSLVYTMDKLNHFEMSIDDLITSEGVASSQNRGRDSFFAWYHSQRNESSSQVPCASECSPLSMCVRTGLDIAAMTSRKITYGCNVVYYTVGFHRQQYTLRSVDDSMMPSHCFIAFIKTQSPLGETNASSHRGWRLVKTDFGNMEKFGVARRVSRFPKITPTTYFADTVRYAVYFDTRNKPRMKPETFVQSMNNDGKKIALAMLFHPHELQTRRVRTASMEINTVLQKRYTAESQKIKIQRRAYDRAVKISQGKLMYSVTPTAWMIVHDLKSVQGHQFRCRWYAEYLMWADRDQPALFYVLAKTLMDNDAKIGKRMDDTLVPIGGAPHDTEYLKLFNHSARHRKYLPFFSMGLEKDKGYYLPAKTLNRSSSELRNFG